jgi:acyl-coenzyme A thioesterase PaaI-like protein
MANKLPQAYTANLNVNFRKPVQENSTVIIKARLHKIEGRKIFMESTMHSENDEILVESTTLFITAQKG